MSRQHPRPGGGAPAPGGAGRAALGPARPGDRPYLLFVKQESGANFEAEKPEPRFSRFRAFAIFPGHGGEAGRAPATGPATNLSPEMARCVRIAFDIARRVGSAVRMVDVSDPGADVALVRRWVGPETMFPLLVAPDERLLEGASSFVPSTLTKFLRRG